MNLDESKTRAELHSELAELRECLVQSRGAEKALKLEVEKSDRLASFPDVNPSPVLELDYECNIKYMNPATIRIFPDLPTLGTMHPFLSDCPQLIAELNKNCWQKTVTREVVVGTSKYDRIFCPTKGKRILVYVNRFSQQKELRDSLQSSEEKFRIIVENSRDFIFQLNAAGEFVYISPSITRIFGYGQTEFLGRPIWKIIHPDDVLMVRVATQRNVAENYQASGGIDFRILDKSGTWKWSNGIGSTVRDIEGNFLSFIGVARDITEQKRVEYKLAEDMKEQRALYALVKITERENITMDELYQEVVNILPNNWQYPETAGAKIAIGESEFCTKNFKESKWKQSAPLAVNGTIIGRIEVVYLKQKPKEDEGPFLKEERSLLEAIALRLGQIIQRKEMEQLIVTSELKYRRLFESAKDGILIIDANSGQITDVNPFLANLLGFNREDFIDKSLWDLGSFKDIFANKVKFMELVEKRYIRYENLPLKTSTGKIRPVEFVSNVYKVDHHDIIQCNIRDISEREKAQKDLLEAEFRYRTVANFTYNWEYWENPDGTYLYVSPSCERTTGYTKDEFFSTPDLLASIILDADKEMWLRHRDDLKQPSGPQELQFRIRRKDGSIVWIEHSCQAVMGDNGKYMGHRVSNRDVTERKKGEYSLHESEIKYRELAESISDIFFAMDTELKYTYWNKASEKLSGILAKDALGKNLTEIYPDNDNTRKVKALYLKTMATKEPQHLTVEYPGGPNSIHEISAYPTENGVSVFVKDITKSAHIKEALAKSEERFKQVAESTGEIIWEVDANGLYVYCSSAAKTILGYSPKELSGTMHFYDLFPEDCREELKTTEMTYFQKRLPFKCFVNINVHKDGRFVILETTGMPIFEKGGRLHGYRGAHTDITEHKEAEDNKIKLETLRGMNRAKSELLANVSHELRTPLAVIKGYIETLLEEDVMWTKKQQLEFLSAANRESDHLTLLIKDLLLMSRLESGKFRLYKVNCSFEAILESISARLNLIIDKHEFKKIIPPNLPLLNLDLEHIGDVIINFVENAAKFSTQESLITLEAKIESKNLIVSVEDNGIGLSKDEIGNLFDRFYQAKRAVSGKVNGTGLGLSICKGLIEAHKGVIWVESKLDKGSKFGFSIPI